MENMLSGGTSIETDLPDLHGTSMSDGSGDEAQLEMNASIPGVPLNHQHQHGDSKAPRLGFPPTPESNTYFPGMVSPQVDGLLSVKTKLPEEHWRYLDMYFAYTHSWFPVVSKEAVLKTSYAYPDTGLALSTFSNLQSGDHAELWAIFALAAFHQASLQSTSSHSTGCVEYAAISKSLIPMDPGAIETAHINALLILSLIEIGKQNYATASLQIGTAARAIGSDDFASSQLPGGRERARAQRGARTFYGCFVLDTLMGFHFRRLPSLRCDLLAKIEVVQEEGPEEYEPWKPCDNLPLQSYPPASTLRSPTLALSLFNQLIKLMVMLNTTVVDGALRRPTRTEPHILKSWLGQLPANIRKQMSRTEDPTTPPKMVLQIMYNVTKAVYSPSFDHTDNINSSVECIDRFAGPTTLMPSIVNLYLHTLKQLPSTDTLVQRSLNRISSQLAQAWTPRAAAVEAELSHDETVSLGQPRSLIMDHILPSEGLDATINVGPASLDMVSPGQAAAPGPYFNMGPNSLDGGSLERFNSSSSAIDLDALFDALTSPDDMERRNANPQFMQNLGFAPDMNVAEFLTTDFALMDPLFKAYRFDGEGRDDGT